jgi:hypothetical protein
VIRSRHNGRFARDAVAYTNGKDGDHNHASQKESPGQEGQEDHEEEITVLHRTVSSAVVLNKYHEACLRGFVFPSGPARRVFLLASWPDKRHNRHRTGRDGSRKMSGDGR